MAKDFCYLPESPSGAKVAINVALVRVVVEVDERTAAIVFDAGHQVVVKGAFSEVCECLKELTAK